MRNLKTKKFNNIEKELDTAFDNGLLKYKTFQLAELKGAESIQSKNPNVWRGNRFQNYADTIRLFLSILIVKGFEVDYTYDNLNKADVELRKLKKNEFPDTYGEYDHYVPREGDAYSDQLHHIIINGVEVCVRVETFGRMWRHKTRLAITPENQRRSWRRSSEKKFYVSFTSKFSFAKLETFLQEHKADIEERQIEDDKRQERAEKQDLEFAKFTTHFNAYDWDSKWTSTRYEVGIVNGMVTLTDTNSGLIHLWLSPEYNEEYEISFSDIEEELVEMAKKEGDGATWSQLEESIADVKMVHILLTNFLSTYGYNKI